MNIHEYQGKQLLKGYGLPVADGVAIFKASEAEAAAKKLPGPLYVVKSQIHAGGRGKGRFKELGPDAKGGVRLARSVAEVVANANEMLGNTLVTKQTGPAGKQVNRLYIEDGADIDRELYLSLLVDRSVGRIAFVVSTEGGMDIEGVAHDTPEKIITVAIDPEKAVTAREVEVLNEALKLSGAAAKDAETLFPTLYNAFVGGCRACLAAQGAAQSEKLQGVTYRSPSGTTLRLMLDESNVGAEVTLGEIDLSAEQRLRRSHHGAIEISTSSRASSTTSSTA